MRRPLTLAAMCALGAISCGGDDVPDAGATQPLATGGPTRCVVRLHGKGGDGADDEVGADRVVDISPAGNAEGWGGRQWLYFPDDNFVDARAIVVDAAAPCEEVILNGFSNGGAFAAKLYCSGENLGDRLLRVVVDDPVPDSGVIGCEPDPQVSVTLYWTGALDSTALPAWDCTEADWTCEGDTTIGIEAYADALGTAVVASPHLDHEWYRNAPELTDWAP